MRELINVTTEIPNSIFNLDWTDIFGYVFHYDKIYNADYLFIIHCNGIIKYNLDDMKIEEQYPQFIDNEYMIKNYCCIDSNQEIIYMSLFREKKIITFNVRLKKWNLNFIDYNDTKPKVYRGPILSFIPNPVNEVRLQCPIFRDGIYKLSTYKINKKGKLILLECSDEYDIHNIYNPKLMDDHLYVLKQRLSNKNNVNLDIILKNLFRIRSYQQLVQCHFAWNQIIFFIVDINGFYTIDCVDIIQPVKIYSDIKRIKSVFCDTVGFDQNNNLHHVCVTKSLMKHTKAHSIISLRSILPEIIIKKNKKRNYHVIKSICTFHSRKYYIKIPTVIFSLINNYYSVF